MVRLGVFDEAAFLVMFGGHNRLKIDMLNDVVYHKIVGGLDAFVEIDGANEGFEGVGKGGLAATDFMVISRFAEDEVVTKLQASGKTGKGFAVDNFGSIA